jgi:hypothetical protein
VNDEQDDVGPIVVLDLEDDGPADCLGLGQLGVVVEPVVSRAADEQHADSQAG